MEGLPTDREHMMELNGIILQREEEIAALKAELSTARQDLSDSSAQMDDDNELIAKLKAEVERLREDLIVANNSSARLLADQRGAIYKTENALFQDMRLKHKQALRRARAEALREVLAALNEMPRCTKVAFIEGAIEIRWLKQLEEQG